MRRLRQLWKATLPRCVAATQFAFLLVAALKLTGWLEPLALQQYDALRVIWSGRTAPAPITLVGATEADLNRFGWPLSDQVLSAVLERLESDAPAAIGVDLYRDQPRPPGFDALEATLKRHSNIYVVFKFADGGSGLIPAPAILRGTPRAAFADVIIDGGGIVRRTPIFLDDGKNSYTSLDMSLALAYLRGQGIAPKPDPLDPSVLDLGKTAIPPLGPDDGPYDGVDTAGYQMLLDYRGGAHPFTIVSLAALMDGVAKADLFRGRIVVVGVAAESVKDFFFTPFSHGLGDSRAHYGIELHGHAIAQLLRYAAGKGRPLRTPAMALEWLWLWLATLGAGLLAYRVRAPLPALATLLAGLAVLAAIAAFGFRLGWWVPLVPPGLGWLASAGLVLSVLSREEQRQRQLLMGLFARAVSPQFAQSMWQERDAFMEEGRPRSQSLIATVLFTDIRGFTSISEGLAPQDLMAWLNQYMETMASQVIEHGGVVDKFIGDAVMAIFGVPIPRKSEAEIAQDAAAAADCALGMAAALERLNAASAAAARPLIGMRVGIYTGPLVVGPLGSAQRLNYTVIGDTVNVASRLESFDKEVESERPCRILIGDPTKRLLGPGYACKPVGEVHLKGKEENIMVWSLLGRSAPDPSSGGKP